MLAQSFDENRWLWLHGAAGILTIAGSEGVSRLDSSPSPWVRYRRWVASFRRQLKQLGRSLLGPLEAAYLEALLLGDGRGIPREAWDAFKRTGVVHVLVVSGLHVGLIASILLMGLSLLRVPRALRYFLVAVGLASYCVLTGGNPPILRAAVMGIVLCLGRISGQEVPALNSLGLAALLILAVHPRSLLDASFQLSFAAVLGLFALTPWFTRRLRFLWRVPAQGLAASAGAWVAVAPIAAWHFHLLTPVALVANLVVIPWASILMATGFLIYAVGWVSPLAAAPFAASFSGLLWGLNRLVKGLADLPGACWTW